MSAKQAGGQKTTGRPDVTSDAAAPWARSIPIRFAIDDGRRLKGPRRLFLPVATGVAGQDRARG
jgi:hypothetical protein